MMLAYKYGSRNSATKMNQYTKTENFTKICSNYLILQRQTLQNLLSYN